MSTPSIDATQQEPTAPVDSKTEPSIEEQLATAEQRRKDTQSAFTKGQQTIKSLEAQNAKLLEIASSGKEITITPEQKAELDDLKFSDPDAWRNKINSLENESNSQARANIAELTGEAKNAAEQQFELSRRQEVLKEFNASAKVAITEELIVNEVPPRITKKLSEGKISFEEFLQEVSAYVDTGKVVKNEDILGQPNLGNLGGGVTPTDMKPEKSLSSSYSGDIY